MTGAAAPQPASEHSHGHERAARAGAFAGPEGSRETRSAPLLRRLRQSDGRPGCVVHHRAVALHVARGPGPLAQRPRQHVRMLLCRQTGPVPVDDPTRPCEYRNVCRGYPCAGAGRPALSGSHEAEHNGQCVYATDGEADAGRVEGDGFKRGRSVDGLSGRAKELYFVRSPTPSKYSTPPSEPG